MIDRSILQSASGEAVHFVEENDLRGFSGVKVTHIKTMKATKAGLMKAFAAALALDKEFGANWDALLDALRSGEPLVLAIHGAEALWAASPRLCGELVETWLAVAEEAREEEVPRHLIFVW